MSENTFEKPAAAGEINWPMVTTMGLDCPEESLPARLGGRHPRYDFGVQVNMSRLCK